jgi:hypothetical protein
VNKIVLGMCSSGMGECVELINECRCQCMESCAISHPQLSEKSRKFLFVYKSCLAHSLARRTGDHGLRHPSNDCSTFTFECLKVSHSYISVLAMGIPPCDKHFSRWESFHKSFLRKAPPQITKAAVMVIQKLYSYLQFISSW